LPQFTWVVEHKQVRVNPGGMVWRYQVVARPVFLVGHTVIEFGPTIEAFDQYVARIRQSARLNSVITDKTGRTTDDRQLTLTLEVTFGENAGPAGVDDFSRQFEKAIDGFFFGGEACLGALTVEGTVRRIAPGGSRAPKAKITSHYGDVFEYR
jgi:hypothetical protein